MAAQTLPGAVVDQIIECTESCGTQSSDNCRCTSTASESSGHGTRGVGGTFEKGHRATRVVDTSPSPNAPGWAVPQKSGGHHRANGSGGEGN